MKTHALRFIAVAVFTLIPGLSNASTDVGHVASRQGNNVTICLHDSATVKAGDEFNVTRNIAVQHGSKGQPYLRTQVVGIVRVSGAGSGACQTATLLHGSAGRWNTVTRR